MSRHAGTPPSDQPMMTVRELAERWKVDVKTIYAAIELGQIPAVRISKRVLRIPRHVVERFEKGCVVLPGEP